MHRGRTRTLLSQRRDEAQSCPTSAHNRLRGWRTLCLTPPPPRTRATASNVAPFDHRGVTRQCLKVTRRLSRGWSLDNTVSWRLRSPSDQGAVVARTWGGGGGGGQNNRRCRVNSRGLGAEVYANKSQPIFHRPARLGELGSLCSCLRTTLTTHQHPQRPPQSSNLSYCRGIDWKQQSQHLLVPKHGPTTC